MAETNLTRKSAKLRAGSGELSQGAGCQSDYFDDQETIGASKTAADTKCGAAAPNDYFDNPQALEAGRRR